MPTNAAAPVATTIRLIMNLPLENLPNGRDGPPGPFPIAGLGSVTPGRGRVAAPSVAASRTAAATAVGTAGSNTLGTM